MFYLYQDNFFFFFPQLILKKRFAIHQKTKQEQLDIENISNYKVNLHPHKYFKKNINKNDLILN